MSKYGHIVETDAELKPCPFCGGKCYIIMVQDRFYATCDTCTCRVASDCLDLRYYGDVLAEVIEAWNTRAERTCKNNAPSYLDFLCSECGFVHYHSEANDTGDGNEWNYCPNCGARVVGE